MLATDPWVKEPMTIPVRCFCETRWAFKLFVQYDWEVRCSMVLGDNIVVTLVRCFQQWFLLTLHLHITCEWVSELLFACRATGNCLPDTWCCVMKSLADVLLHVIYFNVFILHSINFYIKKDGLFVYIVWAFCFRRVYLSDLVSIADRMYVLEPYFIFDYTVL